MFYEKKVAVASPSKKRYLLSRYKGFDEKATVRTLPCDYSGKVRNFGFENGKLTHGDGFNAFVCKSADGNTFTPAPVPAGYEGAKMKTAILDDGERLFTFLLLLGENDILAYNLDSDSGWKKWGSDRKYENVINYLGEDGYIVLLSGGGNGILIESFTGETYVADALEITDMCVHNDRVFGVVADRYSSVWFSDAFDPYNWNVSLDEGGYVTLDGSQGKVLKLVSFNDYLYIFCEYGIYRMTAYADQLDFSIKRVARDCGHVFKDSICVFGSVVCFATTDGVYVFDGYDVGRLTDKLDRFLSNAEKVSGVCYSQKYRLLFPDPDGNGNLLASVDMNTGVTELYSNTGIYDMTLLAKEGQTRLLVRSTLSSQIGELDDSGKFFGNNSPGYWEISDVDFNDNGYKKHVVGIDCDAQEEFLIGISADGVTREYRILPMMNYFDVDLRGYDLKFYIKADCNEKPIGAIGVTIQFEKENV